MNLLSESTKNEGKGIDRISVSLIVLLVVFLTYLLLFFFYKF